MSLHSLGFYSIIFSFLIISSSLDAQEPPIKWGDIPRADIEMTSFPLDTNASALILCDYGESSLDNDLNVIFKRHIRIKIFNQKGYKWANHSVVLYTENKTEFIEEIEGVTYSLDAQGKIIKSELDEDEIYEERIDKERTAFKFTLPSLKPGCVIEIKYRINSEQWWFMRDWDFQHDEPVRWSEYRIKCPMSIQYAIMSLGYEQYTIQELIETTQVFGGEAASFFHETIVDCNYYRWALKDAPAIRDEQFVSTVEDYKNKIVVQLSAYAYPGGVKRVLNDWKTLVNDLVEHEHFGELIDDTRAVKKLCNEITVNCKTDIEKVEAVYDWVTQSIVCTETDECFGDQEPDDVLENKKGNNADITFLFLSLMKCLKIEADPVILSTRDHGKIHEIYPMVTQFNYVMARVLIDSQFILMDPTDPFRSMDILPFRVLNTKGLIIKEDTAEWTSITSNKFDNEAAQAKITINSDGTITGFIEAIYTDYAALFFREKFKDMSPAEIATNAFYIEKYGLQADSINITGLDSIKEKVLVKIWFTSSGYAQKNGDLIYINPFLINRMTENPLKSRDRKFPIDFGLRSNSKTIYTYIIPDDFEIKENVSNKTISPAGAITYDRRVQVEGNQIQIADKIDIKELEIKPKFYQNTRQFYSRVIDAQSEQIVLQRKLPESSVNKSSEENTEGVSK